MEKTEYKLYYFNYRGLAEPIRLVLKFKGIKFQDIRFPLLSVPPVTPLEVKGLCPYKRMPILEFNGEIVSQSLTIIRYLARKYDLMGSNDLESVRCDEIVEAAREYWGLWILVFYAPNEEKKMELQRTALEKGKSQFLVKFNQLLSPKKKGEGPTYFVGNDVTYADIYVAHMIQNIESFQKLELTQGLPELAKLVKNVFELPGIKEWVVERPKTDF